MNESSRKRPAIFQPAEFLSAMYMLRWAGGISIFFAAAHLAGLREFTCVLNGTVGSVALGWQISQLLALVYILSYLAFVILTPILVLAALLLTLWERGRKK